MYGSILGNVGATFLFLLFQACGVAVARACLRREKQEIQLLLGSVCGSIMLQWFPVFFSFFCGFTLLSQFLGALLAVACGLWALWATRGIPLVDKTMFSRLRKRKFLLLILLTGLFYCFLVYKSYFLKDGHIFSSQATYGDTSMHLSFITSLARQGEFPPMYSLLPGTRLSYPFLSDSISSSLYLCGASLRFSYMLPMFFAGLQVLFGFYLFASQWLKGKGKAAFAFVLFFFNGGLGVLYFLGGETGNFSRIFTEFYQTPTNLIGENIRWVNVLVDMMLPQRATLFGWAVLFSLLWLLYRAVYEGRNRYFVYCGVLGGLLPMIHTHSFLAFALVCAGWMLFSFFRGSWAECFCVRSGKALVVVGFVAMCVLQSVFLRRPPQNEAVFLWLAVGVFGVLALALVVLSLRKLGDKQARRKLLSTWVLLLCVTCLLALPQLFFWTFSQVGSGGFVRGHFGWVIGTDSYLLFYLKNIGITAVLAFCALLLAKNKNFAVAFPALLIWFLGEFVEFQPNDYDNNKLFYVAFAFLCCLSADLGVNLLKKIRQTPLRVLAATAFFCCTTVSALLTMGREAVAEYVLFGADSIQIAQFVEETLPPDAVVLTDTRHNNEIAALTGRNVVCGSPAYLHFHGLDYYAAQDAVEVMYGNPRQSEGLFRKYGVDYALVSDFERNSYGVSEEGFNELFPCIYSDGSRYLYQVKGEVYE